MAINLTDTSYSGEAAQFLILRPVETADTFEKGCISVHECKKEFHIPRLEIIDFIQADSATPTTGGTIDIDGVDLVTKTWQVYVEFNPQVMSESWFAKELQDNLLDRKLPSTVESYLMRQLFNRHNLYFDQLIWRGDTTFAASSPSHTTAESHGYASIDGGIDQNSLFPFDGLIKQALNDPSTIIVSGTTITSSNAITSLTSVYNAVPKGLLNRTGATGLKFLVNKATLRLIHENYNITTTFKNGDYSQGEPTKFLNYELVAIAGVPDNTIIAMLASPDPQMTNAYCAVNQIDEETVVKMAPKLAYSDIWFIRGKVRAAAALGFADQMVLFTTITA